MKKIEVVLLLSSFNPVLGMGDIQDIRLWVAVLVAIELGNLVEIDTVVKQCASE